MGGGAIGGFGDRDRDRRGGGGPSWGGILGLVGNMAGVVRVLVLRCRTFGCHGMPTTSN